MNRRAFTIIETTFALALLLIIIISFIVSLITAVNYLRRSMELRTAALILQEEISVIRDLKYSDIQSLGGTFSSSDMASLRNAVGTINKSNYGGSDKILKITLKLDWKTFENKPVNKTITSCITDHGIDKK